MELISTKRVIERETGRNGRIIQDQVVEVLYRIQMTGDELQVLIASMGHYADMAEDMEDEQAPDFRAVADGLRGLID